MTGLDHRLLDIETKIAYQEHLLGHLNDALTNQQKQLDALRAQIERMNQLLDSPQNQTYRPEEEAPPPHY